MLRRMMMLVVVLLLSGCGSSDGILQQELSLREAPFQILDLAAGTLAGVQAVPDLATNPAYRSSQVVFRRIEPTGRTGFTSNDWPRQDDEEIASHRLSRRYVAVFELTRGQWLQLASDRPWVDAASDLALPPADADDTANMPVIGLSFDRSQAWVATANNLSSRFTLRLATAIEWELFCLGGRSGSFSWGETTVRSIVADHAVLWHTTASTGPSEVGSRQANAWGLFDCHGNVAEFTGDGNLRGGSWRQDLATARAANRLPVDNDVAVPFAGLRLVLVP